MANRPISNLALFVDTRRNAAVEAAKAVAEIAAASGVALQLGERQAKDLGLNGAAASSTFPAKADVLVSLGGDGTLLQAAHLAGPLGIPLIGVDFGRVGRALARLSRGTPLAARRPLPGQDRRGGKGRHPAWRRG